MALTGGVASGKSMIAAAFAALAVGVVDTDVLARELVVPGMPALAEIVAGFGPEMLRPDGSLDRARLRAAIFADPAARQRLEAILHPRIRALAALRVQQCVAPYVLLVVPLLTEHIDAYRALIDRVLVVDCPEAVQRARLMKRDGLSELAANAMLSAQVGRAERLAIADDRLDNSADIVGHEADWARRMGELHATYLQYAHKKCRQPLQ